MKLIDRIRIAEQTLETRLEQEKREAAEAQKRLDDEERNYGRKNAYNDIPNIDRSILARVDEGFHFYRHPVGRGRSKPMTPFEEAYADYLIEYFRTEGLAADLINEPIYQHGVVAAHDYLIEFKWSHA